MITVWYYWKSSIFFKKVVPWESFNREHTDFIIDWKIYKFYDIEILKWSGDLRIKWRIFSAWLPSHLPSSYALLF